MIGKIMILPLVGGPHSGSQFGLWNDAKAGKEIQVSCCPLAPAVYVLNEARTYFIYSPGKSKETK